MQYQFVIALIFLGCLPDYVPECFHKSDTFICPASACNGIPSFFPCSDGKYCIWRHLVCDGYSQCEDGSGNSFSISFSTGSPGYMVLFKSYQLYKTL